MPDTQQDNSPTIDIMRQLMSGLDSNNPQERIRAEAIRDVLAMLQASQLSNQVNQSLKKEQPAAQATQGAVDGADLALHARMQQQGALPPQGAGVPSGGAVPPAAAGGIPPQLLAMLQGGGAPQGPPGGIPPQLLAMLQGGGAPQGPPPQVLQALQRAGGIT